MKKKLLWICAAVVPFLMMAAPPARAQALGLESEVEAARREGGIPVGPGLWRLYGEDPTIRSTADLAPLRRMVGKATVVGLGEAWHTSGGFYKMKDRVFRDLVQNMGFRVFAIESHWASGEKADHYVQTCEGSPAEALNLHIPVWESEELVDLIQWMCEWNQAHPNDRVHYMGFDIQRPDLDGPSLIAFLGRIGIAETHAWVKGIRECEGVIAYHPIDAIPPQLHEQCMAALAEIEGYFQSNAPAIEAGTSKEDFDRAQLRLLSLKANQEEYFYIGPDYIGEDFAKGFNKRDEAMAKVFFLLRDKLYPNAKTVVWAANIHVARALVPNGALPLGSFLAKELGRDYVNFALAAYHSELDLGNCQVREAVPGSIEERLHKVGEDALLVDLARSKVLKPRAVYEMGTWPFQPRKHFNGILFLENSDRMVPTAWPPCKP